MPVIKKSRDRKVPCCDKAPGLREMTFVYSLIIFVLTALITMCFVLGSTHTESVLDLINSTIQEEEERTETYLGERSPSLNENRLHKSKLLALSLVGYMTACAWISFADLIAAGVLMYGVAYKVSVCMLPYIVFGLCIYISSIIALVLIYLGIITAFTIGPNVLWVTFLSMPIFGHIFLTLIRYYNCLRYEDLESIAGKKEYEAYGGYKHTIYNGSVVSA